MKTCPDCGMPTETVLRVIGGETQAMDYCSGCEKAGTLGPKHVEVDWKEAERMVSLVSAVDEALGDSPGSTTGQKVDPEGVDHPKHYNQHPGGIECIDVIEHMPHNVGAAVKYLWRVGLKGDREDEERDLRKAVWYIERELKRRGYESV